MPLIEIRAQFKNYKMGSSLHEKQSIFLQNVAKLVIWSHSNGFVLTGGELYRTAEQQEIYVKNKRSKTKRSKHQDRLAIDLNLFIDGKYITDTALYKPLAEYWKSLNENNISGYEWGWDGCHFEMN